MIARPGLFFPDFEASPRAVFSPCVDHALDCDLDCRGRRFRYELEWPTGAPGSSMALFILANPSTATHQKLDPTVTRCVGFARSWGHAWCGVANVRAWRETDPKLVPPDPHAIGPGNDWHIGEMVRRAEVVVCGWGTLGGDRGRAVLDLVRAAGKAPMALRLNRDGSPAHPLYLPRNAVLTEIR